MWCSLENCGAHLEFSQFGGDFIRSRACPDVHGTRKVSRAAVTNPGRQFKSPNWSGSSTDKEARPWGCRWENLPDPYVSFSPSIAVHVDFDVPVVANKQPGVSREHTVEGLVVPMQLAFLPLGFGLNCWCATRALCPHQLLELRMPIST